MTYEEEDTCVTYEEEDTCCSVVLPCFFEAFLTPGSGLVGEKEEGTCVTYEDEDTCVTYEEEDTTP